MTSFYSDLAATVLELMDEFGQDVQIRQQGPKTTNAAGVSVPSNPTAMSSRGVMFDFIYRQYGNEVVQGTLIQSADKQLFIAPTSVPPQPQDRVLVAGVLWSIVNIKQINPAGTVVLYELWLKR